MTLNPRYARLLAEHQNLIAKWGEERYRKACQLSLVSAFPTTYWITREELDVAHQSQFNPEPVKGFRAKKPI